MFPEFADCVPDKSQTFPTAECERVEFASVFDPALIVNPVSQLFVAVAYWHQAVAMRRLYSANLPNMSSRYRHVRPRQNLGSPIVVRVGLRVCLCF